MNTAQKLGICLTSARWRKSHLFLHTKNCKQTLTFFLCLISLNILYSQESSIIGPQEVCGGCHEYSVEFQATGEERYEWGVLTGNNFVEGVGNSKDVQICWDEFTSNGSTPQNLTLIVSVTGPDIVITLETAINIQNPTSISIIPIDAPLCSSSSENPIDSIPCAKVCANTTVSYTLDSLQNGPGGTFPQIQWEVSGAEDFEIDSLSQSVRVNWGNPGFGEVSAFYFANGCEAFATTCIEVINLPKASISTLAPADNNELTVCSGETVVFQNDTEYAETYEWQFGDLGTSTDVIPSFTFTEPGSYTVSLLAYNECACVDSTSMLVKVLAAESPSLDCIGTVCEGESITYTAQQTCGLYNWIVSDNGDIIDGGTTSDDFVTIQWMTGDIGEIELLVSDCPGFSACPTPTTFQIPIISPTASIQGASIICSSAIETYQLPPYSGTSFNWASSNGGTIVEGQGTNEVIVDWSNAGNTEQWVAVNYENCFLGCGGADTLAVVSQPTFRVEGPLEVCEGDMASFTAINNQTNANLLANWGIIDTAGDTLWQSTNPIASPVTEWSFPPAEYTLFAIPDDPSAFCLSGVQRSVRVAGLPPSVAAISGDTLICTGQVYNYQVIGAANFDYEWEIIDGSNQETKTGASINVSWGNTLPYRLSVTRIARNSSACRSLPVNIDIATFVLNDINGPTQSCVGDLVTFETDLPENIAFDWQLSPANTGDLISESIFPVMDVYWQTAGTATISLAACNQTVDKTITVNALPQVDPLFPDEICTNETVTLQSATTFSTYRWLDEVDNLLTEDPSLVSGAGTYQLEVTDSQGCTQDTAFTIQALPPPIISISTPDFTVYCNSAPQARLFALEGSQAYQYQWFRDGQPVGTDSPLFTATALGRYTVEARLPNGCVATSNEILLIEDCTGGGGIGGGSFPDCPANANPAITITPALNCNERSYESLSSGMIAGTANWFFDDPASGANNTSTADQPTHLYTRAGYFRVFVLADYTDGTNTGGCFALRVDTIPIAANFQSSLACSGSAISFTDLSTFLPGVSIANWAWDFGDPTSGIDNSSAAQNPTHLFATGGTYTVSLTITAVDGCQSILSKEIEVQAAPDFTIVNNGPRCEGTGQLYTVNTSANLIRTFWDFDDPLTTVLLEGEEVSYNYDNPGTYDVSVMVEDVYGCLSQSLETFTVVPNTLTGSISSTLPNPICEGDSTLLSPPVGGDSWVWSLADGDFIQEQIWVKESDVVGLVMTDATGCVYKPAPLPVVFTTAPSSFIRAVEYDENGEAIAYHYDSFEACFGSDIVLEGNSNLPYNFHWSDGTVGPSLSFTKESGNVLSPGEYEFFLTLVDNANNCSAEIGPFVVTIHQVPAGFAITSNQSQPICPGQNTTLTINNPDPSLTYLWNTGENASAITVNVGGNYQARAISAFGCESQSNIIEVLDGPAIDLFPSGCHSRCSPDTICLPVLPDVVSIQWFKDGVSVQGPEGTANNLPIDESGSYSLSMEDVNGCVLETATLDLTLFESFGDIGGQVFYDVNENGVIDASDTLVSGISIQRLLAGSLEETAQTDTTGSYLFPGLEGDDYVLVLDTLSLPPNMMATEIQQDTSIQECAEEIQLDWLLSKRCITTNTSLELSVCSGTTVRYNGTDFSRDTTFTNLFQDVLGCDSIEMVQILFTPAPMTDLIVEACAGKTFEYQSVSIPAGSQQSFILSTATGCDSIVRVQVLELPNIASDLELFTCPGQPITYEGVELSAGAEQGFTFTAVNGCDSIVNVRVSEIPLMSTSLALVACEGGTVSYGGQEWPAGTEETFTLTASSGCDSLVTLQVISAAPSEETLELFACSGEMVEYNGQEIEIGEQAIFTLVNAKGCDSLLTINVLAYPSLTYDLSTTATCENTSNGTVQAINITGLAQPVQYAVDDQPFSSTTLWEQQAGGAHVFKLMDENGCVYEDAFVISETPALSLSVVPETIPCDGSSVSLSPIILSGDNNQLNYEWENGSSTPFLVVEMPGEYEVIVSNGCDEVRQVIPVIPERGLESDLFYVPNAFSPNEDGVNEVIQVFPAPDVQLMDFKFHIFDRWGKQMFYSTDIDQSWNGIIAGQLLRPAVFVWYLEASFELCGQTYQVQRKGDVVLIR